MSNANHDIAPEHIKPPARMPVEDHDKIMIDSKKGKKHEYNSKRIRKS